MKMKNAKEPKYICRKPGPASVKIIERDSKVMSPSLTREYSFVYKKAKGCYVWDVDGRQYLDFSASVAVMNIGHTNPVIAKAIRNQIKFGIHCGFSDFYAELPVQFAEQLLTFLPFNDARVFFSNSGTESIECAYKLARWHTNKKWTIAFNNAFHGRTMGSLSMTKSKPVHRERFEPFLPVKHVPYPYYYRMGMEPGECSDYCLNQIEKSISGSASDNTAAIFLEPIQGEGGYIVPPKEFVKGVRRLCNEHNILMCADEVQSGCYRTGKFLAIENFDVKPDIVSLSKSIGGGIPLGATIAEKKIMDWPQGAHANTFGGNLIACAAGIATLKYMRRKNLGKNAEKLGSYMHGVLNELKEHYEIIGDVRGIGLMIGVELVKDKNRTPAIDEAKALLCKASEKGLILLPCGKSTIRICPPLTLTKEQADKGLSILEESIREVKN